MHTLCDLKTELLGHDTFITLDDFHIEEKKNPQKANKQIVSRLRRRQVLRIRMVCLCLAFNLFFSFVNYIKCIGYLSLLKSSPDFCFLHINVLFPCINPLDIWSHSLSFNTKRILCTALRITKAKFLRKNRKKSTFWHSV